jgi:hypothetical protein
MTKTELQIALAEATQTNKRTAALFLDTLSSLAYKAIRKEGEFVFQQSGCLLLVSNDDSFCIFWDEFGGLP